MSLENHADHTTHFDDCGCSTKLHEAKVAILKAEVERLRGALLEIATGTEVWTREEMIDFAEQQALAGNEAEG